ncbi:MAG: sugar phosphate isomerase/epimerase [Clostridia bacterium]|nr:sugar phosphate isomerase/epimerase [Clostridia bacterium]
MYKIGLSTTGEKICEKTIKMYGDAGLEYIEISCGKQETDSLDYEKLKEWCDKYSVKIWSLHLPFWPFDEIDISSEALADFTVDYLSEIIKRAGKIGIDKFIIHPSGEPIDEDKRQARMDIAKKSLSALAEVARGVGATICVEDLPRTCLGRGASDILELLSAHKDLRACFDTNHLLNEDNIDFIKKIGDKIVTLHVSDYDFINERHWLPGEGKNDWQGILNALKEIGYSGIWLYEINMDCPKTINRPRRLTVKDFQKNAEEVFTNSKITVISTPKENLGYWD